MKRLVELLSYVLFIMLICSSLFAEDKLKGEEGEGAQAEKPVLKVILYANFNYALPMLPLKDSVNNGYGGSIIVRFHDLGVNNYFLGISVQFLTYDGRKSVHHANMIPMMLSTGYGIKYKRIRFIPVAAFGGTYNSFYRYTDPAKTSYRESGVFQPIISAGVALEVSIVKNYYFQFGADFNNIFELHGNLYFFTFTAGLGVGF